MNTQQIETMRCRQVFQKVEDGQALDKLEQQIWVKCIQELIDETRAFLDFAMWLIVEYKINSQVKYSDFVNKTPDGEIASERQISFIYYDSNCKVIRWLIQRIFQRGAEPKIEFTYLLHLVEGEIRDCNRYLVEQTKGYPLGMHSDFIPSNNCTKEENHSNYLKLRKSLLDYYEEFCKKYNATPLFDRFPNPVELTITPKALKPKVSMKLIKVIEKILKKRLYKRIYRARVIR
ncbi:MAG: hypothetical protein ABIH42_02845 [Planctomycetota bacterium]